jgi:ferredoxin
MADDFIQVGNYKVKVDRAACISAGSCIAISPAVFAFDGENKAIVNGTGQDTPENILAAAQSCPTKAIIIQDATTGQQVWPQ